MTQYQRIGIFEILDKKNLENTLLEFEGYVGGLAFDRTQDKPKIAFSIHGKNVAIDDKYAAKRFIIVRFYPQENETPEVYAALEAMKLTDSRVKIKGMYIKEDENKFITADYLTLEPTISLTYTLTSEEKIRRIVERID